MSWEVFGTTEFADWYATLDEDTTDRVNAVVDLLEQDGPDLPRPVSDTLEGSTIANLKELRTGSIRILYVFDPKRRAVLLLGGDKEGQWSKWYRKAIPEAEAIYERYLKEMARRSR